MNHPTNADTGRTNGDSLDLRVRQTLLERRLAALQHQLGRTYEALDELAASLASHTAAEGDALAGDAEVRPAIPDVLADHVRSRPGPCTIRSPDGGTADDP